ncbi:hypothetical protein DT076_15490 [Desertihabitans brevis]|uniref:ABM domain-containing protein n=1 Tax=Desertihabitans brevis TaxID=2268447 RepID=A0A367YRV6_9ACTN|nr:hypothetical protein [Desertihabitans brevis]RCK68625.1 hypothetical protein DT076_15490 [Desertihabitans brevis]
MIIMTIRTQVRPEHAAEVESAVGGFFAALRREELAGIRYTSCRLADGITYLTLLELADGVENPLPTLPEFAVFQDGIRRWAAAPPVAERWSVVARYEG